MDSQLNCCSSFLCNIVELEDWYSKLNTMAHGPVSSAVFPSPSLYTFPSRYPYVLSTSGGTGVGLGVGADAKA